MYSLISQIIDAIKTLMDGVLINGVSSNRVHSRGKFIFSIFAGFYDSESWKKVARYHIITLRKIKLAYFEIWWEK